jgi:hypothetical protein
LAPEISEKARGLIDRVDALLDQISANLDDESKSAVERMSFAAESAPRIQGLLGEVVAEGLTPEHPALAPVGAKVHAIGARLNALGAADTPPTA